MRDDDVGSGSEDSASLDSREQELFRKSREIFEAVIDDSPAQRVERARELADDDDELAARVAELLESFDDSFLERPQRIGPYRVTDVLGEGGMGVVYLAEQPEPRREVALKVLRIRSRELLMRFTFECQALAMMSHPGVAQVYGSGTTDAVFRTSRWNTSLRRAGSRAIATSTSWTWSAACISSVRFARPCGTRIRGA